MENLDLEFQETRKEVKLSETSKKYFATIAGWGVGIGIYGFLITVFMFVAAFKTYNAASEYSNMIGFGIGDEAESPIITWFYIQATIFLIMGVAMIFPGVFLVRYSSLMRNAIRHNDQYDFDDAVKFLRNVFVFAGIYALLTLALIILTYLDLLRPDGL